MNDFSPSYKMRHIMKDIEFRACMIVSLEISEGILRNQKIIIGLDSFSNQRLIHLAPLCIDYPVESCKITVILFGSMLPNL